ncbi:sensor histidine kinase [Paraglaciecola hydrolytica]|uniref:histidine kinase n=1 Tax=Paraglaciecola hydrolytica TaxID=1799789 RepID=A0A136A5V0_9ALTE|nr:HAMP domain-containing sensor histidine kinase [Paraglaciecola hydrolytica]KXI30622.1 ATPase [Paraglaciecola hydrolytica]
MQLGSLRQLTLVSFVLVLVPLLMLLTYSQITLSKMGHIATSEAEYSVAIVRKLSRMESLSVDVERLFRQFHVLKNIALKNLAQKSIERFVELQTPVCSELEEQLVCRNLTERLNWLGQYTGGEDQLLLDAQLAEFKSSLEDLSSQVETKLDIQILAQQDYVTSVLQAQIWLTVILVGVSLLLILFGTQVILKPVEKLELVIKAISRQEDSLPTVSTSGPKELIVLEHNLHHLAARLEQLENLRHALLRHASHELKTPLASIKEGCSLLSEQVVGELNPQQVEVVSLLNSSTDRLNLLIMQLLDYNLLLQQAKPVFSEVDSNNLLQEFVTDNTLAIQQNSNPLELKIELDSVYADPNLLRRILDNLLSNALAHGSKGRPITVHLYAEGNKQVLDVANRGPKVPDEQRPLLFQPFRRGQSKRNDRVVGSGLGLSIVADCARMMHGKAEIVDVEQADFCVRVTIPRSEENI